MQSLPSCRGGADTDQSKVHMDSQQQPTCPAGWGQPLRHPLRHANAPAAPPSCALHNGIFCFIEPALAPLRRAGIPTQA